MRTRRFVLVATLIMTFASAPRFASAQPQDLRRPDGGDSIQSCQPGIEIAAARNPEYLQLYSVLLLNQIKLKSLLSAVENATSYEALLTKAKAVASLVTGGRLVVTLADGTVVVDTATTDDRLNNLPQGNSYEHFVAKTVNENHNSRISIFSAQLYPCGLGLERKLSTSTGVTESYVAVRLGAHLDSVGTARLSAAR